MLLTAAFKYIYYSVLFLLCVTMCSYASTRAESVGYCVAITITFFIYILKCKAQTRFRLTDSGSHHTGAVLQIINLLPRYNRWIIHYDTNFFSFVLFVFLNFLNVIFIQI